MIATVVEFVVLTGQRPLGIGDGTGQWVYVGNSEGCWVYIFDPYEAYGARMMYFVYDCSPRPGPCTRPRWHAIQR